MLRLARQRLGFTQKEAAARLGVAQPVLSRFENGLGIPDSTLLMKAAQVYHVPQDFFDIRDPVYGPPVSVHPVMTRGRSDVTARELDAISAELNIRMMHLARFLDGVDFNQSADIPAMDVEQYGSVERIAATVRAHWRVPSGPVRNVTDLVEQAGAIVGFSRFAGASVSGVTMRVPGRPPLILLNRAHPADRKRWTLCHELGHLVCHSFPTPHMEEEANRFASAFLMPEAEIGDAFFGRRITLELLAGLKKEWRVSMQSLLYRANELGYVTANQYRYLWQQISARGWRLREPADTEFEPEAPQVLPAIMNAHFSVLDYSPAELQQLIRIHEGEFHEMYGEALGLPKREKFKLQIVRST